MIITSSEPKSIALRQAWNDLKKEKPTLRIRDCAHQLGVSEAELLATTVGEQATRLVNNWEALWQRMPALGNVMSLTRNEGCVLEHKGIFKDIDLIGPPAHRMATVIGPIETRVFFNAWAHAFAVRLQTPHGLQQSIQVFDKAGHAITKVFLQPGSDQQAFDQLVLDFTAVEQSVELNVTPYGPADEKPIEEADQAGLLTDWENMKDTHDFFGMLRKYKVNRLDAVVLAANKFTHRLQSDCLVTLLEAAAKQHLPIMVFAGNRGNIQIHQDEIKTVRVMDNWLNILDPAFNMHLRQDLIDSVWVVKKPTTDGVVTAVEVFDANKEMIVQFFGLRKPGIPELDAWRELVALLPAAEPG